MLQKLMPSPKISSQPLPKYASISGFPSRASLCRRGSPWVGVELLGEQIPARFPWGWGSQEDGSAGSCLGAELPPCCPGCWGHIPEGSKCHLQLP